MKWLCDEMLRGLGRWLRVAGYDTKIAEPGMRDRTLVEQACAEKRILLTRDRKMLEIRHADECVCLLQGNAPGEWVCELNRRYNVDWHLEPFSRCLLCNASLQQADDRYLKCIPSESREMTTQLLYCPQCEKLYWEGTHVRRMRKKLDEWERICRD